MLRGVGVGRLFALAVLAAVVGLASVPLAPDCASACSCATPAGVSPRELVQRELSYSDAVFAGEVIGIDEPLIPVNSTAPTKVTLRVSEAWKGAERGTLVVQTAASDASCGYPFDEGESYLVFASEGTFFGDRGLEVALCGSTKPLAGGGKALATLGPGSAPTGTATVNDRLPDTSGARPNMPGSERAFLLASCAGALILAVAAVRWVGRSRW